MIFQASLDKQAKTISVVVTVLYLFIIIVDLTFLRRSGFLTSTVVMLILLVSYSIVYLYRPVSYEVKNGLLTIHRPVSDVNIQAAEVIELQKIAEEDLGLAFRVFGVGGLFGYFGKFSNARFGNMTWYGS